MKNFKNRNVVHRVVVAAVETMEQRTMMSSTPITPDTLFGAGGIVSGVETSAGNGVLTATNPVNGNVFVVGFPDNGTDSSPYEVQEFTSSGTVVTSYGNNGLVTNTSVPTPVFDMDAAAVQPDGKLLVLADTFATGNTGRNFYLTRYTASGAVDTTFGTGGTVSYFGIYSSYAGSAFASFTILPNGDIAIPGMTISNNVGLATITAYTSAGTLDKTFGINGVATGAAGSLNAITVDASGNLISVGSTSVSTNSPTGAVGSGFIEKFTPTGKLDQTFGTKGSIIAPNSSDFYSVFVNSTGVSVFGALETESATFQQTITLELNHYTPSGQVDTTFGSGAGYVALQLGEFGYESAFQTDGKLLIFLQYDSSGGAARELVRLNTDGSLDSTFGTGGYVYNQLIDGLSLELDNQVVYTPVEYAQGLDFAPARLLLNGSPDTTFGPGGVAPGRPLFGSADAVAELPNGETLIAGIETLNGLSGLYIARYTSTGAIDSTFAPRQGIDGSSGYIFIGPLSDVQSDGSPTANQVGVDASGNIYLDEVGVGILRFTSNGALDTTFGTNGTVVNTATIGFFLEPNGQILNASNNGTVTRLNANGTVDQTFGTSGAATLPDAFSASNDAIALQSDGKMLIGGSSYSATAESTDLAVLRLNTNGSVDSSFGVAGIAIADQLPEEQDDDSLLTYSASVTSIAVLASGTIVAAGSGGTSGHASYDIGPTVAEFLSTGKLNPAFGDAGQTPAYVPQSNPESSVVGLVVESDGTLIVGGTQSFGFPPASNSLLYVLRYNSDGSINNIFTNQIIPGDPDNIGDADTATGLVAGLNGTVVISANLVSGPSQQEFPGLARYIVGPTAQGVGALLTGTVIGSTGSYGGKGNTTANAFDRNLNTFFDAKQASGDWAGLDLGSAKTIAQISFAPRAGWESRMLGGVFQGSNSATFSSGVTTLYTITTTPTAGRFTTVNVTASRSFRYVRYLGPANSYCNIAEAEFFSAPAKLTGTVIGTAGSYENQGNTIANVFDGNLTTFFDAPTVSSAWVGLDLGSAQTVSQVSFAPRDIGWSGFAQRMVGGQIQASNTADFSSGVVTVYTITTAPPVEQLTTVTLSAVGAYRYWRYIGPVNGSCNIAELAFIS
jgi:uncharacterized delta-60 repeat protein